MADFVANVPISRPVPLPNFSPDVDLGGLGFSYDIGLMYQVFNDQEMIKTPPPGAGL